MVILGGVVRAFWFYWASKGASSFFVADPWVNSLGEAFDISGNEVFGKQNDY